MELALNGRTALHFVAKTDADRDLWRVGAYTNEKDTKKIRQVMCANGFERRYQRQIPEPILAYSGLRPKG
jgi:hypothetical protein